MLNVFASSTRSARQIMSHAGEYFCQACGRHTSHAAEKRKQASAQYTPPKYCSKRCKSSGKPSLEVVLGWKRLLDQASKKGKRQAVMCSDVQQEVFGGFPGSPVSATDEISRSTGDSNVAELNQQLGMKRAKDREDTRRAARLISHFGFQHFRPISSPKTEVTATPSHNDEHPAGRNVKSDDVAPYDNVKLEAVQNDKVIQDVTHAKGEWGLRYRRD